jgi:alcohol dehydrogenase class IV
VISVPTTLSAAEFTYAAGATAADGMKMAFGAPQFTPRVVVLDPELTLDTPMWLWGTTGMRALDHAVETVYSKACHPFAEAMGLHAAGELVRSLDRCLQDPGDIAARGRCQVAAWMSITPFSSVKTGLSHEVTLHLGARCHIPHGVTSAIVLPAAMAFNRPASTPQQARLAEAMGVRGSAVSNEVAAAAAAERLRQLASGLSIKTSLSEWGVSDVDIEAIALACVVPAANPREASPEQIITLLRSVM